MKLYFCRLRRPEGNLRWVAKTAKELAPTVSALQFFVNIQRNSLELGFIEQGVETVLSEQIPFDQ